MPNTLEDLSENETATDSVFQDVVTGSPQDFSLDLSSPVNMDTEIDRTPEVNHRQDVETDRCHDTETGHPATDSDDSTGVFNTKLVADPRLQDMVTVETEGKEPVAVTPNRRSRRPKSATTETECRAKQVTLAGKRLSRLAGTGSLQVNRFSSKSRGSQGESESSNLTAAHGKSNSEPSAAQSDSPSPSLPSLISHDHLYCFQSMQQLSREPLVCGDKNQDSLECDREGKTKLSTTKDQGGLNSQPKERDSSLLHSCDHTYSMADVAPEVHGESMEHSSDSSASQELFSYHQSSQTDPGENTDQVTTSSATDGQEVKVDNISLGSFLTKVQLNALKSLLSVSTGQLASLDAYELVGLLELSNQFSHRLATVLKHRV